MILLRSHVPYAIWPNGFELHSAHAKIETANSEFDNILLAHYRCNFMTVELQSDSLWRRFLLLLFGIFAGLALLLACIGIYGVLAYVTNQRVPEIGLRMALGASARDVMQLVVRQSLRMIFVGDGVGVAVAAAAARLLERLVAGVRSTDPLTFAIMISVLVGAALFASFLPARYASRVDPLTTLRQE
jgi:ABC-type antimicrobial peptide transport system permease subunit